MTYDAVWTVNHNPLACGTAKFSHQLAERLGVPCLTAWKKSTYPLVSVRSSEVPRWPTPPARYDLLLHDWELPALQWLLSAERVFAANGTIADQVRAVREDVITVWCPSTLQGNPTRGAINVLTFGMAHKIQTAHFLKLRALLDAAGQDYTVSVSCAIHEGSPWSETWQQTQALLGGIFGERLRVLGFLADDALAREMQDCTAIAVFYDPALRSNNTSFWGAAASGKPIITNRDRHSPTPMTVYDIDDLVEWPRLLFQTTVPSGMTWDGLIDLLNAKVPA